jgi:hypothetical protein
MLRRAITVLTATVVASALAAGPALACGGLIGKRGAVQLLRTTTFAGYTGGVEHYVTSFSFAGAGGAFGSITPLPGVPTDVKKGGQWTLQRLIRETTPQPESDGGADRRGSLSAAAPAKVLIDVDIDALDVTVLEGGAVSIGTWAKENGFVLPPDAPEVLEFYARRSPIFMAVRFDADRAAKQGLNNGDGTPVHLTIPTTNPWVPLRILGLGKQADEQVQAEVYLLTDRKPALLPSVDALHGMRLTHSKPATASLLDDLRSDKGMGWVPKRGWLTRVDVDGPAGRVRHDLAIDASGQGTPSLVAAGLTLPALRADDVDGGAARTTLLIVLGVVMGALLVIAGPVARRLPTSGQ